MDELLEVRKIEPHLELAAIVPFNENFIPEWDKRKKMVQNVITLNFPIIVTRHKNVDKELIDYSHERNLKVFTYTINTMRTHLSPFFSCGVRYSTGSCSIFPVYFPRRGSVHALVTQVPAMAITSVEAAMK